MRRKENDTINRTNHAESLPVQPKPESPAMRRIMANAAKFKPGGERYQGPPISQPGDEQEKEADAIAKKVMTGEGEGKSESEGEGEGVGKVSASNVVQPKHEEPVMAKSEKGGELRGTDELQQQLTSSKSGGQALDDETKAEMEGKLGADLSDVRIHTGAKASEMSEGINAKAFTHGQDIYFKDGNFDTQSEEGRELLAHELVHTVQQGKGVGRMVQRQEDFESNTVRSANTRELVSDSNEKVEVGTNVNYSLIYTNDELWSGDSKLSYKWTIINPDGSIRFETITDIPNKKLEAKLPGSYTIQVEVLNNGNPTGSIYKKMQTVYFEKKNTELGKLNVGNFDFYFDGDKVIITARVKFDFEKGIPVADHSIFKSKFFNAIRTYWTNSGVSFVPASGNCFVQSIPLYILCFENEANYHKLVHVTKDYRRPNVISDMNLYNSIPEETIAHEFGHVLGLYDEYDGGTVENMMWWHDNTHVSDVNAMMNSGSELRKRYFEHYLDKLNTLVETGHKYKINSSFQ